jgi:hypothetical protein
MLLVVVHVLLAVLIEVVAMGCQPYVGVRLCLDELTSASDGAHGWLAIDNSIGDSAGIC